MPLLQTSGGELTGGSDAGSKEEVAARTHLDVRLEGREVHEVVSLGRDADAGLRLMVPLV